MTPSAAISLNKICKFVSNNEHKLHIEDQMEDDDYFTLFILFDSLSAEVRVKDTGRLWVRIEKEFKIGLGDLLYEERDLPIEKFQPLMKYYFDL